MSTVQTRSMKKLKEAEMERPPISSNVTIRKKKLAMSPMKTSKTCVALSSNDIQKPTGIIRKYEAHMPKKLSVFTAEEYDIIRSNIGLIDTNKDQSKGFTKDVFAVKMKLMAERSCTEIENSKNPVASLPETTVAKTTKDRASLPSVRFSIDLAGIQE